MSNTSENALKLQKAQKSTVRSRVHPVKALSNKIQSDENDEDDANDVADSDTNENVENFGKKSIFFYKNDNIIKHKKEVIVTKSSGTRQKKMVRNCINENQFSKAIAMPITHHQKLNEDSVKETSNSSAAEHQQQNINPLSVSDRMSKEKQKFFRFSVFNSERKSKFLKNTKLSKNDIRSANDEFLKSHSSTKLDENDKYAFVSSSDSENDQKKDCDNKKSKVERKIKNIEWPAKEKYKLKEKSKIKEKNESKKSNLTSEDETLSTCCSSDEEESVSTSASITSSSSGTSTSSDDSSSTGNTCNSSRKKNAIRLTDKTDAINTMNVFACINSRDLENSKKKSNCWTALPFIKNQQSDSLFKVKSFVKSKSFGLNPKVNNEIWGFAAEAKKDVNIFSSDSLVLNNSCTLKKSSSKFSKKFPEDVLSLASSKIRGHMLANEYFATNRRTTTLMNNNSILSSDDEAKQLSPSKMFKKAVNYKKFDNNKLYNKKLIMDPNINDAKSGQFDHKPVKVHCEVDKEPNSNESTIKHSQSPYNHNNQFDMGKNYTESI